MTFSENPSKLGWPSFHSDHWDPFWTACSDENVVVCLHIGSSSQLVITSPDAPIDCLITLTPINIVQAAADLIWSPVLRKFPNLKIALSGLMMLSPVFGVVLLGAGGLISFISGVWMVKIAFEDSLGTGLGFLFIPFYSLMFILSNLDRTGVPFLINLVGAGYMASGLIGIALRGR